MQMNPEAGLASFVKPGLQRDDGTHVSRSAADSKKIINVIASTNASASLGGIVAVVGREQPHNLQPQANIARPATVTVLVIVLGVLGAGGSADGGGAAPPPLALGSVLPLRLLQVELIPGHDVLRTDQDGSICVCVCADKNVPV